MGQLGLPTCLELFRAPPGAALQPIVADSQTLFLRTVLQIIHEDEAYATIRPDADVAKGKLDAVLAAAAARDGL